ncbi:MAG TPA: hypothetical protein DEO95_08765 [Ruminococcaceae bacterium]|nr:hypothetical protein [Oscillospiraceae bacterium]
MTEINPKENILFSPDPADKLNDLFAEKIAKYLFLFCNYNPISWTGSYGYNYSSAVTNRYRLLKDTGDIIADILRKYVTNQKFWNKYFHDTSNSRSVLSHNNSPENGFVHRNTLQEDKDWYKKKLGEEKNELAENDFKSLLNDMLAQAEKFRKTAECAIKNIPESDRKEVIKSTIGKIIDFYCKPTNMDITIGQMVFTKRPTRQNAAKIFKQHLCLRDPELCNSKNPSDYNNAYMKTYFRKDLERFLDNYIKKNGSTLLPAGLIQEFVYTLVYPFRKGMKENIILRKEDYTKISDEMGIFRTNAEISNIPLNVIVIVDNTAPAYIDSLVNTTDGVTCIAVGVTDKNGSFAEVSELYIDNIDKSGKMCTFKV